ncbi:MAG TPA: hypothetical protein VG028_22165 [Terriglobia bacterium]|nr:hypothetical protein [Terriglobia bacterium]
MLFWQNPEFIRHARAELRPARAVTAAALALVICALIGLACWASTTTYAQNDFFPLFYFWTMGFQFVVLTFWCASACGQAIAREREMKTYDFLKTTRLSAAELMVGKLLGVPILAYYTVGCTVPLAMVMGIVGGYGLGTIALTYLLLLALGLFVSIMALWTSMQVEGASARTVGLLVIFPIAFTFGFAHSPFAGFGALSIFPALFTLYRVNLDLGRISPTVFGWTVSFPLLTLTLYLLFGAWFALMLVRNLKKEIEGIRLLSRWQAIGFAAFLNLLFYAFLNPRIIQPDSIPNGFQSDINWIAAHELAISAMAFNACILYLIGIATLSPQEKLKVWWRAYHARQAGYFSESGPPWPWLIPAALISYLMLVLEALWLQPRIPLDLWRLPVAAAVLGVTLVFVIRDVLFLQWIGLTRMKRPVMKGFFYLWLYYCAAVILAILATAVTRANTQFIVLGALTPYAAYASEAAPVSVWSGVLVGLVIQLFFIVLLLRAISGRLGRPALVPALSEG